MGRDARPDDVDDGAGRRTRRDRVRVAGVGEAELPDVAGALGADVEAHVAGDLHDAHVDGDEAAPFTSSTMHGRRPASVSNVSSPASCPS